MQISSPEVINALSNQLVDSVAVLPTDQTLNLFQLLLQLLNACITNSWCDPAFLDLLHSVLDVFQVSFDLAHHIIPQMEAWMTLDALWEDTAKAASALITVLSCCSLYALTCPC